MLDLTDITSAGGLSIVASVAVLVGKLTFLLGLAFLGERVLRRASAGSRHSLWSLMIASALLLPGLAYLLPATPVAFLPARTADRIAAILQNASSVPSNRSAVFTNPIDSSPSTGETTVAGRATSGSPFEAGDRAASTAGEQALGELSSERAGDAGGGPGLQSVGGRWTWTNLPAFALGVWALGCLFVCLRLAASLVASRRLRGRARRLCDEPWSRATNAVRREVGIRRGVSLLLSSEVRTPSTGGILSPFVVLPCDAEGWSEELRRVVLRHELVHIRRNDLLRHCVGRITTALYWFHPLTWIAVRRAGLAREQACDEAVLALGVRPSEYARHLLDLADTLDSAASGWAPAPALPMIEILQLERRLMAILDGTGRSRVGAPLATTTLVVILLATLSIASASPRERPVAGEGGAQLGGAVVNVSAEPLNGMEASGGTPAGAVATITLAPAAVAATRNDWRESTCGRGSRLQGNFRGSMSTRRDGVQLAGTSDGDRIVQYLIEGTRLCMRVSGDVELSDSGDRVISVGDNGSVRIETEVSSGGMQQLEISAAPGVDGSLSYDLRVDGAARPYDESARLWQNEVLSVLADYWEIAQLRGRVSTLHGQISTIHGQRSTLYGRISTVHGQRSTLHGKISTMHGQRSTLQGKISSVRGQVSSLRGAISSHQGAISSLRARLGNPSRATDDDRQRTQRSVEEHQAAIAEIDREIEEYGADSRVAEVEKQIEELHTSGQVEEVEREIETLEVERRVAEIEREIEELRVEESVDEIEVQIEALDADRRVDEIKKRLDAKLPGLRGAIDGLR